MTAASGQAAFVAAVRELNGLLVGAKVDDARAAAAATQLRGLTASLGTAPGPTPWWWGDSGLDAGPAGGGWGRLNPVAPPLLLTWDGEVLRGSVQLGVEFTGPPLRAHGGAVATILDHALGILLFSLGRPSVTRTLTLTYLRSTPLHVPLEVVAEVREAAGDATSATSTLLHDGVATARAEGTFVLTPERRRSAVAAGGEV